MMRNKAVFLDKDGTLIKNVPYNVNPKRIQFYPEAYDALYTLHQAGFLLVVVSNQSGVAHGYFKEDAFRKVKEHIQAEVRTNAGVPLAGFYYCPHHPDGTVPRYSIDCACRKPKPGLLFRAGEELNIDLQHSWMVGDILNDVEAGNQAGCATVLIDNGNETEWFLSQVRQPDFIVTNLYEAVQAILSEKSVRKYRQPHLVRV